MVFGGFRYLSQMSPGTALDPILQLLASGFGQFGIALLLGILEPLVILDGELGVDGQPYDLVLVIATPRQLDGEFDPFPAVLGGHVLVVLVGVENLLQHPFQLDFAPGAPGLDVGQHPFQIAHAHGQGLHFAQALVDLFQPLADQLEGLAQPFFQGALEFFIHGLPHFFQLLGVVLLNLAQAGFDGFPHGSESPVEAVANVLEGGVHRLRDCWAAVAASVRLRLNSSRTARSVRSLASLVGLLMGERSTGVLRKRVATWRPTTTSRRIDGDD